MTSLSLSNHLTEAMPNLPPFPSFDKPYDIVSQLSPHSMVQTSAITYTKD